MSIVISVDGKSNIIKPFDSVHGKTSEEILRMIEMPKDLLAIKTPFFMEPLPPKSIPTDLFPELSIEDAHEYCYPDYYLKVMSSSSSIKIAINVQPVTQMQVPLPKMQIAFKYDSYPELLVQDMINLCATTFGYESCDQKLMQGENELDPSSPAPPVIEAGKKELLVFQCTVLESSAKKIRQRNAHAHEFLDSEKTFIENLECIINYLEPEIKKKGLFDEKEHRKLFRDIPTIYDRHMVLYKKLQEEGASYCSRFAGIMLEVIDNFKVSAAFVSNFKTTDEMIKQKRETRSFDRVMSEIEDANPDNTGRPFMAYYITPVQRYPRYPLLLRDLDKVTPPWHPDKQFFQMAAVACERVNKEIDHVSYRVKQLLITNELQKELPEDFALQENGREVLQKTSVRFTRPKSLNGLLYLFSDIVLLTIKQKKTQTPVVSAPISEFIFANNRPNRDSLTLLATGKLYTVVFDEPTEREAWFEAFNQIRNTQFSAISCDDSYVKWRDIDVAPGVPSIMNNDCVSLNGIAYFLGGLNQSLTVTSTLVQYNYAMNEWTVTNTPIPPRYSHAMAAFGGKIYVFFGKTKRGILNDVWSFDPKSGNWEQIKCNGADNQGRFGHTAVTIGDNIVLFGGQSKKGLTNDLLLFNPISNNLTEFPPGTKVPPPRMLHSASSFGNKKMIVLGGKCEKSIDGEVYVFNLAKNAWHKKHNVTGRPRYNHRSFMVNNCLLVVGGSDGKTGARLSIIDTSSWVRITPKEFGNVASGLTRFAAAMINDTTMVTLGGADPADKIPSSSSWVMEIGCIKDSDTRHVRISRKKESLLVHRAESSTHLLPESAPAQRPDNVQLSIQNSASSNRLRHKSVAPGNVSDIVQFKLTPQDKAAITRARFAMGSDFNEDVFAKQCGIDFHDLVQANKLAAKMKLKKLYAIKKKNMEDESKISRMKSIISGGDPPENTTFLLKVYDESTDEIQITKVTNEMDIQEVRQIITGLLNREAILSIRIRPGKMGDLTEESLHEAFCHVYRREMPALMISAI